MFQYVFCAPVEKIKKEAWYLQILFLKCPIDFITKLERSFCQCTESPDMHCSRTDHLPRQNNEDAATSCDRTSNSVMHIWFVCFIA